MDWGKAKSILIIVFVGLNLFLLINIVRLNQEKDTTSKSNEYTTQILKANNIELKCEIPDNVPKTVKTYVLSTNFEFKKTFYVQNSKDKVEYLSNNKLRLTSKSVNLAIKNANQDTLKKEIVKRLNFLDSVIDEFVLDYYSKENGRVRATFLEKKDKLIFYDNIIDITLTEGNLICEIGYNKYDDLSDTRSNVMPMYQILLKEKGTEKNLVIKSIDIGVREVHKNLNQNKRVETVWRLNTSNGLEYFVASSGEFVNVEAEEGIK